MESKRALFEHTPHPHEARNVNEVHKNEQEKEGFNTRIAVLLTRSVGTMICAYFFALLAIVGFPGLHATLKDYVHWLSQTFIQLVMLSVIMVGQNVLNRKSELQSEEDFKVNQKSFHDIKEVMNHLPVQDGEILRQAALIEQNSQALNEILKKLNEHTS